MVQNLLNSAEPRGIAAKPTITVGMAGGFAAGFASVRRHPKKKLFFFYFFLVFCKKSYYIV